jgi:hypothetical protein
LISTRTTHNIQVYIEMIAVTATTSLDTRHVPQLSGNGREDTGGMGDAIKMENETSGTGLTTTQKLGVRYESQAKEGARNSGSQIKCCWWSKIGA